MNYYDIPEGPDHERYRKCPECGHEFLTDHLLRIYCSNKCHDRFNSRKRRQARKENPPATPVFYNDREAKRHQNLLLLDRLKLPVAGMTVDANALEAEGYDFRVYDQRIPLPESPGSYTMTLGNYHIRYWQNYDLHISLENQ